jgi:hypothetical protein
MRATYLVAGLFKDGRMDPQMFPAETAFEMATLGGAKAMGLADGSARSRSASSPTACSTTPTGPSGARCST